jgi:hypothetical protein
MPNYRVMWMIDIENVESAHQAAEHAYRILLDPNSIATVFEVMPVTGNEAVDDDAPIETIDLTREDDVVEH